MHCVLRNFIPVRTGITHFFQKKMKEKNEQDVTGDLSDRPRKKSFTPNWQQSLSRTVGLPVKFAGKVVSVYKDTKEKAAVESDNEIEEEIFLKRKRSGKKDAQGANADGNAFFFSILLLFRNKMLALLDETKVELKKKKKVESVPLPMQYIAKSAKEIQRIRIKVAEISFCLTTDPSAAFRAKSTHHITQFFSNLNFKAACISRND